MVGHEAVDEGVGGLGDGDAGEGAVEEVGVLGDGVFVSSGSEFAEDVEVVVGCAGVGLHVIELCVLVLEHV